MSPLIEFVVRGLHNCWLPDLGRWSHIYHLDGRTNPNESVPHSDVFYTLNVLLAFSRLGGDRSRLGYDVGAIFQTNADMLRTLPVSKYAYGMALWAAADLNLSISGATAELIEQFIKNKENWTRFRAQDMGMILSGCIAQSSGDPARWSPLCHDLYGFLVERFSCPSGLFFDEAGGLRRRWASFATQTYLSLACYHYAAAFENHKALDLALTCTKKLISLQGPQGEWPWFFDVPRGCVADFYEVYSVHQDGMAPAFLEHAEKHMGNVATDAIRRGFAWIYGENQLRKSMLVKDLGLIIRSHVRKGELNNMRPRVVRAVANTIFHKTSSLIPADGLELRLECRSYHLGWVIWSFAQRTDLPEITHHPSLTSVPD